MAPTDHESRAVQYLAVKIDLAGEPAKAVSVGLDFEAMKHLVDQDHVNEDLPATKPEFF